MSNQIITLDQQIENIKKDGATPKDIKDYIIKKFNLYKSSPEGCIDYIQECLYVSIPGTGYQPFALWDTQRRMLLDIVECMFDNRKDMYVLLGSRQCGKTTCSLALADWLTTCYKKYNVVLIHVDDSRGKSACEEFRKMRYEKSRYMYFKPIKNALTHQIFKNDSSFQLQSTQKSKGGSDVDTGRGLSVNLLWLDEAGSVDVEKLEASIFPTTSTTFTFCKKNNIPHIILLSGTANGRVGIGKKFYELWKSVEPPLNKSNPYAGGYKLFWRDIPDKTEEWYASLCQQLPMRKVHQEFDCVFYGTENSLFTDEQIVSIQEYSNKLKLLEPNYTYITPQGYLSKGIFFEPIKRGRNYIVGIDTATGRGGDYTAIEIIDDETMRQVFEFRDNLIQNDDLVKTINNIILKFISSGANILLSIESNMTGSAVISDLKALNPIYKTLIYRNTISADINRNTNDTPTDYFKCEYGVCISGGRSKDNSTRELLINYIFKYINNNLECINSKELMQEIESLEINKDGKVVGSPHDDMVFALGHCLLIKNRARKQNVYSIYRFCSDIRNDDSLSQSIQLSLEGFDQSFTDDNNLLIGETGLLSSANSAYNTDDQMMQMPFTNVQVVNDFSGGINYEALNKIREQLLEQSNFVKEQSKAQKLLQARKEQLSKIKKKHKHNDDDIISFGQSISNDDYWCGAVL